MTNEEKQLLLKDLCARLPYGVKIFIGNITETLLEIDYPFVNHSDYKIEEIKPYLRPLSSMTEEEEKQLNNILPCGMSFSYTTKEELIIYTDSEYDGDHYFICFVEIQDWLNSHHFDFRNLIGKGLAIDCTNLNIY